MTTPTDVQLNLISARNGSQWIKHLTDACFNLSWMAGWWARRVEVYHIGTDTFDKYALLQRDFYPEKIALIHSEISEALEGLRTSCQDKHLPHRLSVEVELADACIRIFDLAGAMGLDLGGAIAEKLEYNQTRADHKREAREAEGGKKF